MQHSDMDVGIINGILTLRHPPTKLVFLGLFFGCKKSEIVSAHGINVQIRNAKKNPTKQNTTQQLLESVRLAMPQSRKLMDKS